MHKDFNPIPIQILKRIAYLNRLNTSVRTAVKATKTIVCTINVRYSRTPAVRRSLVHALINCLKVNQRADWILLLKC